LLGKLLEAEADHAEVTRDFEQQIGELKVAKVTVEKTIEVVAINKVDSMQKAANSIQELRETIDALAKQYAVLTRKYDELTSRSAVQHLTRSFVDLLGIRIS